MENQLATVDSLSLRLNTASEELASVSSDFERIQIRNVARAAEAAAAILNKKDIQVQAANLVQDAERAIAKANPPKGRGPGKKNVPFTEAPLPPEHIRKMRQAHGVLPDAEYEAMKAEAVTTQQPLTRAALTEAAQEKKAAVKTIESIFSAKVPEESIYTGDPVPADASEWIQTLVSETVDDYLEYIDAQMIAPAAYLQDVLGQDWAGMLADRYRLDFDDMGADTDAVVKKISTQFLTHHLTKTGYSQSTAWEDSDDATESADGAESIVALLTESIDDFIPMNPYELKEFRQILLLALSPEDLNLEGVPTYIQHNIRTVYETAITVLDMLECTS